MSKIIFIVGPTATGKSETAFFLAKELKAEIVSCDSMLIYKEPQIITSKLASYILKEIPHHFVGMISVENSYNVFDYYNYGTEKILELFNKEIPVIVCGGTGLYLKALLDGIFEGVSRDENLRKTLEAKAYNQGKDSLYQELKKVDPLTAEKISSNDLKRIIRALEVYYVSGIPISHKKKEAKGLFGKVPLKIFGLRLKRDPLYERINKRVEKMFKQGAVEEVEKLLKLNLSITAKKIIGIKEIEQFLSGCSNIEEAKELMKKNTRHFAKRQLTWFRRENRIEWIDSDELNPEEIAGIILRKITK